MLKQLAGCQLRDRPGKTQGGAQRAVEVIQVIVQRRFGRNTGYRVDVVDMPKVPHLTQPLYRLKSEGARHAVGVQQWVQAF
ncbi:hypothetical protein D3C81_2085110 [compost metagenome]